MHLSTDEFDRDPFPHRPKILFVGHGESSHTQGWIGLLDGARFNVRLFALPSELPPAALRVKTYVTANAAGTSTVATEDRLPVFPEGTERVANEIALARVIEHWRPHIVHSLGLDPASYLYLSARMLLRDVSAHRWIVQARGGPDIALHKHSPSICALIKHVLAECDHFIADNDLNFRYAEELGLSPRKVCDPPLGVVPGSGGVDISAVRKLAVYPPSSRARTVIWPKAYEAISSKAIPVIEAIRLAWDRIKPCRFELLWLHQSEVHIWFDKMLPAEVKAGCQIHPRLPREKVIEMLRDARVMLAPSLTDGVPNSLLEAMAVGTFPIVSPLETITSVVDNEVNVLFARNLYPDEIASALVRAMSDNELVDRAAQRNLERVQELADRRRIKDRVVQFYEDIARRSP